MKKIIILACVITLASCTSRSEIESRRIDKRAVIVTNHNTIEAVIEVLHNGKIPHGITKINIDTIDYIVIRGTGGALAIVKHQ